MNPVGRLKSDGGKKIVTTERLVLDQLSSDDTDFILKLVNTSGWIEFIGDKKIYSLNDAAAYIQKISVNQNTIYWTVKLKDTLTSIGLVTFIKRDYLPHHDLGFAFLPDSNSKGYAYEATKAVLTYLIRNRLFMTILAITLPHNTRSINLLQKLGFQYKEQVKNEKDVLHVYESFNTKSISSSGA